MAIKAGKINQAGVNYSKLRAETPQQATVEESSVVDEQPEKLMKVHQAVLDHKRMRMEQLAQGKDGRVSSYMNNMLIKTDK